MDFAELIEALTSPVTGWTLLGYEVEIVLLVALTWLLLAALDWLLSKPATQRGRGLSWLGRRAPLVRLAIWLLGGTAVVTLVMAESMPLFIVIVLPLMLGIGLAARDVLRNILAGVLLAFDRDFDIGDVIRVGQHEGEVRAIRMRHVKLRTSEGHEVEIPTSAFINESHVNISSDQMDAQVVIHLLLAAEISTVVARKIAITAAAVSPYASPRRRPQVFIEPATDDPDRVRLVVRGYVFDPAMESHYRSDVMELMRQRIHQ